MPIDAMNKIGTAVNRVTPASPARPAIPAGGQELAGNGKALPPVAGGMPAAEVQQVVSQLSNYVQSLRRDLQFTVDERNGKSVVRVVDSETGETIRQIPSEEILAISRALSQSMERTEGMLLNDRA